MHELTLVDALLGLALLVVVPLAAPLHPPPWADRWLLAAAIPAEAALVLARRVRLDPVPGYPVVAEPAITLRPRHGLRMLVSHR